MIKWIFEEIKDLCNFDWLFWKPVEHKISSSKCIEFNIHPLCCFCRAKEYNTCLIECNRLNIIQSRELLNEDPVLYIRYQMENKIYGDYSKYMIYTVKKFFPEYQNVIDEYTVEQLNLNLK